LVSAGLNQSFPKAEMELTNRRRETMNRLRLLAIATMLTLALPMAALRAAQQPSTSGDAQAAAMPSVEQHLKVLAEKLDLTSDQQDKTKPILQEMQDATQKYMQDESMSRDERRDYAKASRYKADRKLRLILTDEQKKKLDQIEEEWHSVSHGD
jgi:Spy/CpxP family protein refolding chaperone